MDRLLRSFSAAAWLGWQIESNWTRPVLFALYSIVKPLALSGILIVMYAAVSRGHFESPTFAYMFLGNTFYMYVGAVMTGMAYAVIDDRERYQTLKTMYIAPIEIRSYLVGRGAARFVTTTVSVLLTLFFGVVVLDVAISPPLVHWPLLLMVFAVGIVMLSSLGLMLAGTVLLLPHQSWVVGEAVAGALFLFSGAIVPVAVLPSSLRPIAYAMPITYWLELLRRSVAPPIARALPMFTTLGDAQLLIIFVAITLGLLGLAVAIFRACDHVARERGYLDRTTGF